MNIAAVAHRFFMLGGAVLVVIAALQWRMRRREKAQSKAGGTFDADALRILLFASVGILAILVGAGVLRMGRFR